MTESRGFDLLAGFFAEVVGAADPMQALASCLPDRPVGTVYVVGAGKGVAQLARAFESLWCGPLEGVVVTRYGYAEPCQKISVLEARHPVPDQAGLDAVEAIQQMLAKATRDDLVVALITGGGSALLPGLRPPLNHADEKLLSEQLLASGAPISVMNRIRSWASTTKCGGLLKHAPETPWLTYVVSDVPGDDPAEVASGPTIYRNLDRARVLADTKRFCPNIPARIFDALQRSPGPESTRPHPVVLLASAGQSFERLVEQADGFDVEILSDAIEGEAREVAKVHCAIAIHRQKALTRPLLLVSGGETTVTLKQPGRGGRNTEFQLSCAIALAGLPGIFCLAADTDGIDGSEDNAGAFVSGQTYDRMLAASVSPEDMLDAHDSWGAFAAIDALFVPGATGTNINDFRAFWIQPLP